MIFPRFPKKMFNIILLKNVLKAPIFKNIVTKEFILEKGFENTPSAIIYSNKSSIAKVPASGVVFTTLHFLRNLRIGPIGSTVT
jgi:hypothetical protein